MKTAKWLAFFNAVHKAEMLNIKMWWEDNFFDSMALRIILGTLKSCKSYMAMFILVSIQLHYNHDANAAIGNSIYVLN